jgi:hypothetical protein
MYAQVGCPTTAHSQGRGALRRPAGARAPGAVPPGPGLARCTACLHACGYRCGSYKRRFVGDKERREGPASALGAGMQVVPSRLRTTAYSLDTCIAGILSVASTPLVKPRRLPCTRGPLCRALRTGSWQSSARLSSRQSCQDTSYARQPARRARAHAKPSLRMSRLAGLPAPGPRLRGPHRWGAAPRRTPQHAGVCVAYAVRGPGMVPCLRKKPGT